MSEYMQVVTSVNSRKEAEKICKELVRKRIAACVQILGPINSTYWWKGKVNTTSEWICIIKSRMDLYSLIEITIAEIHSYEVPEILAIPIITGNKSYLRWLEGELRPLSSP